MILKWKVVVNRWTRTRIHPEAVCGYVQRGDRKSYMKWVNIEHALDEWRAYYKDFQFVNKLTEAEAK
jgi:hypothetical protein